MTHVFELRGLSPSQRLVALALADHADHDGHHAYPAVDTIAGKTEMHRRTVQRALNDLVKLGVLEIEATGGGRRATTYGFPGVAERHPSPERNPGHPGTPGVAPDRPRGGTLPPHPGQPATLTVLEPSLEPSENHPKKRPPSRPTEDQVYLAGRIIEAWGLKPTALGMPAIQKLNSRYGIEPVTSAMRELHGFPPDGGLLAPFAYIDTVCKERAHA